MLDVIVVSSPSFLFYIKENNISTKVEYTQVLFSLPEWAFHRGSGLTNLKSASSFHLQFQRPNRKGGGGGIPGESRVPTAISGLAGMDADGIDSLCVCILLGWATLYRESGVLSLLGVSWG